MNTPQSITMDEEKLFSSNQREEGELASPLSRGDQEESPQQPQLGLDHAPKPILTPSKEGADPVVIFDGAVVPSEETKKRARVLQVDGSAQQHQSDLAQREPPPTLKSPSSTSTPIVALVTSSHPDASTVETASKEARKDFATFTSHVLAHRRGDSTNDPFPKDTDHKKEAVNGILTPAQADCIDEHIRNTSGQSQSGTESGHSSSNEEEKNEEESIPSSKRPRMEAARQGLGGKQLAKWEEMFERLVKFKKENGHCLVPNRYPPEPALGSWVSTQRRQYKIMNLKGWYETTPMSPERVARLESIGFVWETKDPRHVPWEFRFEQLVKYKAKHGDCLVPIGYKKNVQLANWVSTQRQEYKFLSSGKKSRLTAEKIYALNSVGFIWEAQRGVQKKNKPKKRESSQVGSRTPSGAAGFGVAASSEGSNVVFPPLVSLKEPEFRDNIALKMGMHLQATNPQFVPTPSLPRGAIAQLTGTTKRNSATIPALDLWNTNTNAQAMQVNMGGAQDNHLWQHPTSLAMLQDTVAHQTKRALTCRPSSWPGTTVLPSTEVMNLIHELGKVESRRQQVGGLVPPSGAAMNWHSWDGMATGTSNPPAPEDIASQFKRSAREQIITMHVLEALLKDGSTDSTEMQTALHNLHRLIDAQRNVAPPPLSINMAQALGPQMISHTSVRWNQQQQQLNQRGFKNDSGFHSTNAPAQDASVLSQIAELVKKQNLADAEIRHLHACLNAQQAQHIPIANERVAAEDPIALAVASPPPGNDWTLPTRFSSHSSGNAGDYPNDANRTELQTASVPAARRVSEHLPMPELSSSSLEAYVNDVDHSEPQTVNIEARLVSENSTILSHVNPTSTEAYANDANQFEPQTANDPARLISVDSPIVPEVNPSSQAELLDDGGVFSDAEEDEDTVAFLEVARQYTRE